MVRAQAKSQERSFANSEAEKDSQLSSNFLTCTVALSWVGLSSKNDSIFSFFFLLLSLLGAVEICLTTVLKYPPEEEKITRWSDNIF